MSSYATYCRDQAADCARRARLARSPEIAAYYRSLGLRWIRLAKQAEETGAPKGTREAPFEQATPRRLASKARPSDVSLLAKVYSSIEADALSCPRAP
jgi:hypothetical protein